MIRCVARRAETGNGIVRERRQAESDVVRIGDQRIDDIFGLLFKLLNLQKGRSGGVHNHEKVNLSCSQHNELADHTKPGVVEYVTVKQPSSDRAATAIKKRFAEPGPVLQMDPKSKYVAGFYIYIVEKLAIVVIVTRSNVFDAGIAHSGWLDRDPV